MDKMIAKFPEQLREAIRIGKSTSVKRHTEKIHNFYVAGLGGSGIGANFVAEFIREESNVPYLIGKGYDVPNWIGKNTVAIASSYSGNTEETLFSFKQLMEKAGKVVVVSSGGKIIQAATEKDLDHFKLPDNWSSPRACLGYSLVQQMCLLNKLGIIGDDKIDNIEKAADLLDAEHDNIRKEAKEIAAFLQNTIPVIYVEDRMEAVAVRCRQQINENSKMLCWHHIVPEMNHNELVGWSGGDERFAVLYIRNEDDFSRNQTRMRINQEIIRKKTPHIKEVFSKGDSFIEKALYLVHLLDWVSFDLSVLNGVDPVEIKVIDYLKSELAKV